MTNAEIKGEVKALIENYFDGNVTKAVLKYHLLVMVLAAFGVKYTKKDLDKLLKSL